jgi:hypothetical protein
VARRGWAPPRLLAAGGALLVTGIAGTAAGLLPGAWLAPATGLAGPLVADRLATALGAGAGGVCIALATGAGLGVGSGIGLGLALAVAGAIALAVAARRMA